MKTKLMTVGLLGFAHAVLAGPVAGLWDATITFNDTAVPFQFEVSGSGDAIQAWFFNGGDRVVSTSGNLHEGRLVLRFDHYASKLEGAFHDGIFEGQYGPLQKKSWPVTAKPAAAVKSVDDGAIPSIGGLWEIPVKSSKGESAWNLTVRQKGAEVSAAIVRVDGDAGALTGRYRDGKFVLSHFSGARPALLELTPAADNTLHLRLWGLKGAVEYTATRPETARAAGLPGPTDPTHQTTVKDPNEPFRFSFPDLGGKLVSNTDPRFQGKVVLVNIMGSWCPNCHDEAPFLAETYQRYRDQGLEIVALSFEEPEQLKDPVRLRSFIQHYGIGFTVLMAGEQSELNAKIPQGVNLNCWPTTFFLGRDGRVRAVHAGFAGRASGDLYDRGVKAFRADVERLLSESLTSAR